eukprot:1361791-Rhodomonas_salina.5
MSGTDIAYGILRCPVLRYRIAGLSGGEDSGDMHVRSWRSVGSRLITYGPTRILLPRASVFF